MRLYYWIEKHLNNPLFKRETCAAYLMEAEKFQTNEVYYSQTNDPATFVGVVYYKNPDIVINALRKIILQLKMPNISDDIKICILAATDFSLGQETLHNQRINVNLCRQTSHGKNNLLARIAYNLFELRINRPSGPRLAWALTKMIVYYLNSDDANIKIMTLLRKEINFDVLEQCLVE